MDLHLPINKNIQMDAVAFKKMCFIYNAIQSGWTVTKKEGKYFFSKKHEGKKEVYLDSYLQNFIEQNLNIEHLELLGQH